eukprot:8053320-Prorocentrum_lima.AAC.1
MYPLASRSSADTPAALVVRRMLVSANRPGSVYSLIRVCLSRRCYHPKASSSNFFSSGIRRQPLVLQGVH